MRTSIGVQALEIAGQAFTLRDVVPADRADVLHLHHRVFGSTVDATWFNWKYRDGSGEAVGLWQGAELVAHCGGVPRAVWHQGRPLQDLQIGDVMVAPEWRGVLTRRGPFFLVSERFYASRLGAGQAFHAGFGFPNERAFRLGDRLGLNWNAGQMEVLTWLGPPSRRLGWGWRAEPLHLSDPAFDEAVAHAWAAMKAQTVTYSIGVRDAAYLRWRFGRRPDQAYDFVQVRRPWRRQPDGVAVLARPANSQFCAQWLDWIGPPELLATACRLCRVQVARTGAAGLTTWASPAVANHLAGTGVTQRAVAAVLGMPKASNLTADQLPRLNWWLMGGDTDFL